MLEKILKEAFPDDIVGEYLWFLKSVPKLLNNQMSDLVHLVKTELDVGNNERKLCGKFNFSGESPLVTVTRYWTHCCARLESICAQ